MSDLALNMSSFHAEMAKLAVLGKVLALGRKIAPGLGSGMGAGAAVGGLGGAAVGGVRGAHQERARGGSGVVGALTGALGGGMLGATVGAGLGASGGGLASALGKGKAVEGLVSRGGVLGAGSRFGQRQVHGLTGWQPKGGLKGIKGGSYVTGKALESAKKGGGKKLERARKAHKDTEAMEAMGATSLPGYVKSMATHGVGKTVGTGLRQQWNTSGPAMRGLMFGMPVASVGSELARESKPGEASRLQRAGSRLGDVAWTMGPLPFAGQAAAAAGISMGGSAVGRLLGGKKKPALASPDERVVRREAV